jgi:hypothetical protein
MAARCILSPHEVGGREVNDGLIAWIAISCELTVIAL